MNALVRWSLQRRVLVLAMLLAFYVAGAIGFRQLNIEAYPDPVPPLVDVIAQNPGMSAEEMERYVTVPLEVALAGIPNVSAVRTVSLFGLSDVKLQFSYDFTYQQAEQWVINRLSQVQNLPPGVTPQISPWSPIGEILRYEVVGPPGYSVTDLKTLQDWVLQRRFKAVPGVIDVTGWGGRTRTYDVTVDLRRLQAHSLGFPQLLAALNNANVNVGGQTVTFGSQSAVVRGVGQIRDLDDIRATVLNARGGVPVLLGDVATVSPGFQPRLGIAGRDDRDDIVQGIVLMRRGEQSLPTIQRVEAEVERINATGVLPPGVEVRRIYDRADLIHVTTRTVLHNLAFGVVLIFLVQWMFLGDLRSAVIVAANIPFALFFAVLIMLATGDSANLLSLGAVDFGLVIDATVIMVENVYRHLAHRGADGTPEDRVAVIARAAREVGKPIFFAAAIIVASFLPLFTMRGVEGHIFGPMARTYAYAITGGLLATFLVSPALSALLLRSGVEERDTPLVRGLHRLYAPVLGAALRRPRTALALALVALAASLGTARTLGLEFLPVLEEGNLWIRATMPASVSLEAANERTNLIRRTLLEQPVVATVISQNGRPDDGTDPTGYFNAEFFVPLLPAEQWPAGLDKERLTADLMQRFAERFPGIEFSFSQYIQDNVSEAASGVKGENSIKLFGPDLGTLQSLAYRVKRAMTEVSGVVDLSVYELLGQPTVDIRVDRLRAARYGLAPGDVNAVVAAAIGGQAAGNVYEPGSDRNFPIVVRLGAEWRGSLDALRRLPIAATAADGSALQVALEDVASVRRVQGPSFVYRENQGRYIPIKFGVRGRDLGSTVLEAQQRIARDVVLPPGYRLEWAGEFGNLQDALGRLQVVVPASLLLIALLLYLSFGSVVDTLIAMAVLPLAMVGGVAALWLTGSPFSISAAIGFIGLFGISVMEGILVVSYFNQIVAAGLSRAEALRRSCTTRLRPVMMTCIAACVGLLPAALSTGIGSQVQRPLALVVVGGILLAPILILVVLPVLLSLLSRRVAPAGASPAGRDPLPALEH